MLFDEALVPDRVLSFGRLPTSKASTSQFNEDDHSFHRWETPMKGRFLSVAVASVVLARYRALLLHVYVAPDIY